MADKVDFIKSPFIPHMDKIFINTLDSKLDFPMWALEHLLDDKKDIILNAIKDVYYLGFERGEKSKSAEIAKHFDDIKQAIGEM